MAPSNEAFEGLVEGLNLEVPDLLDLLGGISPEDLLANPDILDILLYHVLGDDYRALRLILERHVTTLQGSDVRIRLRWTGLKVNDSTVESPNINSGNGIIHALDQVL
jgi:uncharacterized surface protein with fasciclin (FAS1) repeats